VVSWTFGFPVPILSPLGSAKMELVVDSREGAVSRKLSASGKQFKTEALDVGDFAIRKGEETLLLIERKTMPDLLSSIKGQRWRNQKLRLLKGTSSRVAYLIEGDFTSIISPDDRKICLNAVLNTILRDGLLVFRTMDSEETATFCWGLFEKAKEFGVEAISMGNRTADNPTMTGSYVETIKARKSANLDASNCFQAMLIQIPGVSPPKARIIQSAYPSIKALMDAYSACDRKETMLADLSEKGPKARKLGPVVSKRIYQFFHGIDN